jgi:hypothetical protein
MRTLIAAALVLGVVGAGPVWAADDPEQARPTVDIQVPAEAVTQRLTLSDGSQLYGRVRTVDVDAIVFQTIAGAALTVNRADISDLRIVSGQIVRGEFQQEDAHNNRLMFAPTARALRRGEGYFGVYYFMPFVQVGVTDRFSVGGGTPLIFGGGSEHPFWVTPKMQLFNGEKAQVAAGVIHVTGTEQDAGIAYAVTTLGPVDRALTVGLGYAYSGDDRTPIVMIGGEHRASRRTKWITENWLWPDGPGFLSGGIRFIGERLSADLSLIVPLIDEGVVAVPLVSFAWHF